MTLGVGGVSGDAVADLCAGAVVTQNSVVGGVAVGAVIGSQRTGCATGVAGLAGEGAIGSYHLEETGLADALAVVEGSVVLSEAGEAGAGGGAGLAQNGAFWANGRS